MHFLNGKKGTRIELVILIDYTSSLVFLFASDKNQEFSIQHESSIILQFYF